MSFGARMTSPLRRLPRRGIEEFFPTAVKEGEAVPKAGEWVSLMRELWSAHAVRSLRLCVFVCCVSFVLLVV